MIPAFLKKWASYLIGGAVIVILLLGFLQVRSCQQSAQRAAESRLQEGQLGAMSNSAADAVNTVSGDATRTADSEAMTRSNDKEIRNAAGANDAVNPASRDAGLRALCRRAAYRNTERCRVFNAPAP